MLRLVKNLNTFKLCTSCYSTAMPYNPALLPDHKSHRKPRWIPIAKSKQFRIPPVPQIPDDENQELLRLFNNYRNNVRSIRKYLIQKHSYENQTTIETEEIVKQFKEDFLKCQTINNEWNENVKIAREARVNKEHERDLTCARKKVEEELIKQEQIHELSEELVKKEKEASVSFITPENIDAVIDKVLIEIVDYNFAIDLQGEKLLGRESKYTKQLEQKAVSVK
ncbi:small ribosomal subunit protein mS26 [Euwallacea fornicatus]|uniref:small ribosomal subunit protein mS26 n=1 Tax=Euwallacea fornicatus TaxID=995702 RepID=UPI00338D83A3